MVFQKTSHTACQHLHLSLQNAISSPPLPLLLLPRLKPNLILFLLLKHLNLPTIPLVLAHPILDQSTHIIHKPFWPAIPHPQAHDQDTAPEGEAERQVDPEDDGAVHHVKDLERDEEDEEEGDDGCDIGLRDEFVEKGREVRGEGAGEAEEGGYDV